VAPVVSLYPGIFWLSIHSVLAGVWIMNHRLSHTILVANPIYYTCFLCSIAVVTVAINNSTENNVFFIYYGLALHMFLIYCIMSQLLDLLDNGQFFTTICGAFPI
jgi:hypothetical protein